MNLKRILVKMSIFKKDLKKRPKCLKSPKKRPKYAVKNLKSL